MSPFLVLDLFDACRSDCCMIFVLTRHKKCDNFYVKKMLLSNLTVLYFVLSLYFGVKAFRMKPAVCEILRTSD